MEKIIFSHQTLPKQPKFEGKSPSFTYGDKEKTWSVSGIRVEPTKRISEIPVMYVTGWGATIDIHDRPIHALAQRGYDVIAINPPRQKKPKREIGGLSLPGIEIAKAEALVETMHKQWIHNGSPVNLVAHSEGAIYGAIGALLALGEGIQVKNLVLVSPAGLIGKDTTSHLIKRFFTNAFTEEKQTGEKDRRSNLRRRRGEAVKAMTHPKLSLKEAHAIAHIPLDNILAELKKRGVNIAVIQGNLDIVFPIRRMEQQAEKAGVDMFYESRGGHNSLITRADLYAIQIDDALRRMSTKR